MMAMVFDENDETFCLFGVLLICVMVYYVMTKEFSTKRYAIIDDSLEKFIHYEFDNKGKLHG